jgi:sucrose-6-phosphate hydrolase SacC (GH32 family)
MALPRQMVRGGTGRGTRVAYDTASGKLLVDRSTSGEVSFSPDIPVVQRVRVPLQDGAIRLDIVVDNSSVEVLPTAGAASLTSLDFPPPGAHQVSLFGEGGGATMAAEVR